MEWLALVPWLHDLSYIQHQSSCNTGSAMQILFWEQQTRIHPFSSARAAVYIFRWYLSCCQGALPRLTPRKSSLWRHNEAMKTAGVDWRHGSSVQWFKKTHCTGAVTIWASISSGTVVGLVVLDSLPCRRRMQSLDANDESRVSAPMDAVVLLLRMPDIKSYTPVQPWACVC